LALTFLRLEAESDAFIGYPDTRDATVTALKVPEEIREARG